MNLEFFGQIFKIYSNIRCYENPPGGAKLFHSCSMWTDGQTWRG